ncbi:hypothetical protein Gocc_2760 [Gaiella occulta]|uniref:Uncharacterized protein n=1 Tax=Gaiella occulta TaxID=1002870 RepID=A0A7M2YVK9_9ACTN|nr:hypothetical protein [Gaiella occulta]RDI73619.1 hypothetical protein Gocc_2760 [Gaiella occulta]
MFYVPFPRQNADTRRAAVVAAKVAARGVNGVSRELGQVRRAIEEPDGFAEAAARIGSLLGFDTAAVGPAAVWQIHDAPGDGDDQGRSWTIAGPDDAVVGELAGAVNRLRALLEELRWRTRLPRTLVELTIERGFSRHDLSTGYLVKRVTGRMR